MQQNKNKFQYHYLYFCSMDDKKTKEAELKAMLEKSDLPDHIRKSIEKKLAYINKPIRK